MILRSARVAIKVSIINVLEEIKRKHEANENVYLGYKEEYQEGDVIQVDITIKNNYLIVNLDSSLEESLICLLGNQLKRFVQHFYLIYLKENAIIYLSAMLHYSTPNFTI